MGMIIVEERFRKRLKAFFGEGIEPITNHPDELVSNYFLIENVDYTKCLNEFRIELIGSGRFKMQVYRPINIDKDQEEYLYKRLDLLQRTNIHVICLHDPNMIEIRKKRIIHFTMQDQMSFEEFFLHVVFNILQEWHRFFKERYELFQNLCFLKKELIAMKENTDESM